MFYICKVVFGKNDPVLLFSRHLLVCSSFTHFFLSQHLTSIIRFCLEEAEKLQVRSVSFPAIGTGTLKFPRDLVSRILLREVHSYSGQKKPRHLAKVVIVVHPSDSQTQDVSVAFV